jgi:hypothetical protein
MVDRMGLAVVSHVAISVEMVSEARPMVLELLCFLKDFTRS